MRIISKTRDYYDGVQRQAQDRALIYMRMPRTEPFGWPRPQIRSEFYGTTYGESHLIGFCGKVYAALRFGYSGLPNTFLSTAVWCLSIEDVDAFVAKHCTKRQQEAYWRTDDKDWRVNQHFTRRDGYLSPFAEAAAKRNRYPEAFEQLKCPIWHAWPDPQKPWESHATCNAVLMKFGFQRLLDPYTAFQELSMWLGAQASPEKPIPKVDDKTMCAIKGFTKQSFRKRPTKKARR